ncbi:MAG TPA: adenylate/guanylate cyclase domain-containing protein [Candidatus Dormibacteraeota bacterium]|nr:adenylate/guanylate cyclase domain-containing protein [Candidatus Dormibacteraeota bacterium]
MAPQTSYARNGDVNIAYQVFGEGPVDLAFTPWIGGLEVALEQPRFVAFLERLAGFARVIRHDRRATGLSDRAALLPDLETQVEDLEAVLDATESVSTAVLGTGQGFGAAAMFAAMHPERTAALLLFGAKARSAPADDYPWGQSESTFRRWLEFVEAGWGTERYAARLLSDNPSVSQDPEFVRWFAKTQRHWVTPGAATALLRQWHETDVRDILRTLRVPTLVIAREWRDPAADEYLSSIIPGAEFVRLPGSDAMPWVGDFDAIVAEIERFLQVRRMPVASDTVLATVLFTDVVGSTARAAAMKDRKWSELVADHDRIVRGTLGRFRGREQDHAGDGFLLIFDGPARAIRCACAITDALDRFGIEIRAGVHTGECTLVDGKLRGIAVHIGARLLAISKPGQVLVSSTVKDLVAGSELVFADQGAHSLKGVPGDWRVFSVERALWQDQ